MNDKLILGVDMDGVLADFNSAFIALIKFITKRDLFPVNYVPRYWNYTESVGYTKEEITTAWDHIKSDDAFWKWLPKYPTSRNDLAALKYWQDYGADIYFITNRMGVRAKEQTEDWLLRYGWQQPTVLLTAHKGLAARTLGLTHYIDDRYENVMDVATTPTKTFLMDRLWNRSYDYPANVTTVTSVSQIIL